MSYSELDLDCSPFLIFGDNEEPYEEMTTRNSLLIDALGMPLTGMEPYLDCLDEQGFDVFAYLDFIESEMRKLGF